MTRRRALIRSLHLLVAPSLVLITLVGGATAGPGTVLSSHETAAARNEPPGVPVSPGVDRRERMAEAGDLDLQDNEVNRGLLWAYEP